MDIDEPTANWEPGRVVAIFVQYNHSNEIGFMVGSFDDPNTFVPQYHYGIEGRLKWTDAGASLAVREDG
jgi:hypothetical protein